MALSDDAIIAMAFMQISLSLNATACRMKTPSQKDGFALAHQLRRQSRSAGIGKTLLTAARAQ